MSPPAGPAGSLPGTSQPPGGLRSPEGEEILVGGQAVIEGVMMKMPRSWAVTVRRRNGELVSRSGAFTPWSDRWPVLKWPLLRGPAVLGQMLVLGMNSLTFSADVQAADDEAAGQGKGKGGGASAAVKSALTLANAAVLGAVANGPDGTEADEPSGTAAASEAPAAESPAPASKGLTAAELALSLGMAVGLMLLLFKALPLGIALLAAHWIPALGTPLAESLVSGAALVAVFVGYLWAMSLLPDMKRLFRYHGAEHQLVHVHEKGLAWSVDNARDQPTQHPRCGTSFLFFVVLTSVVVWSVFRVDAGFLAKLGLRLACLPLIMGLSFELIRLSARHRTNPFFRALMAPGLWSQRITTQPPDDSMREVSIRSLELASAQRAS